LLRQTSDPGLAAKAERRTKRCIWRDWKTHHIPLSDFVKLNYEPGGRQGPEEE